MDIEARNLSRRLEGNPERRTSISSTPYAKGPNKSGLPSVVQFVPMEMDFSNLCRIRIVWPVSNPGMFACMMAGTDPGKVLDY